jgi:NADH:ubiquinone oxidoreductase subunit D
MRIADHLVCIGTNLVDLGALTNFWYLFQPREEIYRARRGVLRSGCFRRTRASAAWPSISPRTSSRTPAKLVDMIPKYLDDVDKLVGRNRIFMDRTDRDRARSAEDAINYGFTGPACARPAFPTTFARPLPTSATRPMTSTFPSPTAATRYARYMVRMEEMRQSLRISVRPSSAACPTAR